MTREDGKRTAFWKHACGWSSSGHGHGWIWSARRQRWRWGERSLGLSPALGTLLMPFNYSRWWARQTSPTQKCGWRAMGFVITAALAFHKAKCFFVDHGSANTRVCVCWAWSLSWSGAIDWLRQTSLGALRWLCRPAVRCPLSGHTKIAPSQQWMFGVNNKDEDMTAKLGYSTPP